MRTIEIMYRWGMAALLCAGCDPENDDGDLESQPAESSGKSDSGATLEKANRCSQVCQTNPQHALMQSVYCSDAALPSWISAFVPNIVGSTPPVPEFRAYAFSGDGRANFGGAWKRYSEASQREDPDNGYAALRDTPDSNPNKWGAFRSLSSDFFWTDVHVAGTWASWPLSVPLEDQGESWAIYVYVPPGATNENAVYRVYDGKSDTPVISHAVDQSDYTGATITLFGLSYTVPGWHYLGEARLFGGASVSLDGTSGSGVTFADTVVGIRWGCI